MAEKPAYTWYPFDTAPKTGEQILVFGRWLPFDILEGGQPCMVIASWSTIMSDGTGYHWNVNTFGTLDNDNVTWTHWAPMPKGPEE